MKDSQAGIIEALKYAIQMELDGKKFYTVFGQNSTSSVGRELFAWLAEQEDEHRRRFEQIYAEVVAKRGWPVIEVRPDKLSGFKTLFGEALRKAGQDAPSKGDLAAADRAMELEIKSRDFYKDRSGKATSELERSFFTAIAAEEQGHYLAVVDFKEYMADPVGFFTRTERHSVDGQ